MANRMRGNVYIIDSSLFTLSFPTEAYLKSVALYGTDSTSRLTLTLASDTTDSIVALANPLNTPNLTGITFGGDNGWMISDTLRVLLLTAGTGFIYFG